MEGCLMKRSDEKLLRKLNLTENQTRMAIAKWQADDKKEEKGFWPAFLSKVLVSLVQLMSPAFIFLYVCIWQGIGDQGTLQNLSNFALFLIWGVNVIILPIVMVAITIFVCFFAFVKVPEVAFGRDTLKLIIKRPVKNIYSVLVRLCLTYFLIMTGHIATAVAYFISELIITSCSFVVRESIRNSISLFKVQTREREDMISELLRARGRGRVVY